MCWWGHQGSVREPSSEVDQSTLHLIGYHTSQKELRDVYHSVYLLNRAPGFPLLWRSEKEKGNPGDPLFTLG